MTNELDRREFLVATAAVGGGMALSLYLPGAQAAETAAGNNVTRVPGCPLSRAGSRSIPGS